MSHPTTAVKAIPTIHNGVKFRSRLEARWSIFLTACGLDWSYEDEGYQLSDGKWYLPDFKVTEPSVILEVKPNDVIPRDRVNLIARAAVDLTEDGICNVFALVVGIPKVRDYDAYWKHGSRTFNFAKALGDERLVQYAARRAWEHTFPKEVPTLTEILKQKWGVA